jgi:glycosyltransferase involved in cell wall biosynthesis
MKDPLVSVGIPFYNCESCLLNSIRSIFAQTYTHWELVLVDDGSTDSGLKIAQCIDDPRVRLLAPDGQNRKLGARLNQIAQDARGEYLARMDADDLCHPQRLEKQVQFMLDHPEVDIVGCASCILNTQGNPAKKCPVQISHDDIFRNKFKSGVSVVHPSLFARTEWWRRWPYTEHNIRCEDYELWLRVCNQAVFRNLPDILYYTNEFLSYSLTKYARSTHSYAQIVWQYASRESGSFAAAGYMMQRYGQIGVWALAKFLHLHKFLIARRYTNLTEDEKENIAKIIRQIRNTNVPLRSTNDNISDVAQHLEKENCA